MHRTSTLSGAPGSTLAARLCCINSVGRSSSVARFPSGSDIEDVEQLVYEAHLVFDMRLTREAMSTLQIALPVKLIGC